MSFSRKVKKELLNHYGEGRHCMLAEISAILSMCSDIYLFRDKFIIKIQTENSYVAYKFCDLVKKAYGINCDISVKKNKVLKNTSYILLLQDTQINKKILKSTGLLIKEYDNYVIYPRISNLLINSFCCKRAYLRGAFIASASISDPNKTYHLEFVHYDYDYILKLYELIKGFSLNPKILKRKNQYIIYIKDSNDIVEVLNIIGSHLSLMELENVRIVKEISNNVNRKVNCETANLSKTVKASINQINDIEYIERTIGLKALDIPLLEVAHMRIENRDASLKELGEMFTPKISKSGINHRFKKISLIAQRLRDEREE